MEPAYLPIKHPEFKYALSRNPYQLKLKEFSGRAYSDNDTETHAGHWRTLFPDASTKPMEKRRPLHVEIGCNGGHVLLEWAARNPEAAYIGLDWKFKQVYRGAEKALKRGIHNALFIRANAERLHYIFGPAEIDHLHLFFPDPWTKKSQWKHRYITAEYLSVIANLVRPGGTFHIKTDHEGYFDWIADAVMKSSAHWDVQELTRDLHQAHPNPSSLTIPEVTLFERLFIKDRIPIKSVRLVRSVVEERKI